MPGPDLVVKDAYFEEETGRAVAEAVDETKNETAAEEEQKVPDPKDENDVETEVPEPPPSPPDSEGEPQPSPSSAPNASSSNNKNAAAPCDIRFVKKTTTNKTPILPRPPKKQRQPAQSNMDTPSQQPSAPRPTPEPEQVAPTSKTTKRYLASWRQKRSNRPRHEVPMLETAPTVPTTRALPKIPPKTAPIPIVRVSNGREKSKVILETSVDQIKGRKT